MKEYLSECGLIRAFNLPRAIIGSLQIIPRRHQGAGWRIEVETFELYRSTEAGLSTGINDSQVRLT